MEISLNDLTNSYFSNGLQLFRLNAFFLYDVRMYVDIFNESVYLAQLTVKIEISVLVELLRFASLVQMMTTTAIVLVSRVTFFFPFLLRLSLLVTFETDVISPRALQNYELLVFAVQNRLIGTATRKRLHLCTKKISISKFNSNYFMCIVCCMHDHHI